MAIIDLYRDDFPHGSQAGFDQGCHGKAECGNYGSDEFVTCREAQIARAGDYNLRKLPVGEVLRRDLVWPPAPATATAAKPWPPLPTEPMPDVNALLVISQAKDDHDATDTAPVVPASGLDTPAKDRRSRKLPVGDPDFPHGTVQGYGWGCKVDAACPGDAAGTTCRSALRAYDRERYEARKQAAAGAPEVVLADAFPNPAIDPEKLETTAADLLREVRQREGRELHEVDETEVPPEQVAEERDELLDDVIAAIDDLTQARTELAKAKELLEEISAAHAAVVLERDNLADELATVRRANSSLALSIHDLEVEKADRLTADADAVGVLEPITVAETTTLEPSKDVTAPPGVTVEAQTHRIGDASTSTVTITVRLDS